RRQSAPRLRDPNVSLDEVPEVDLLDALESSERRAVIRRGGQPVAVLLSDPRAPAPPCGGYVLHPPTPRPRLAPPPPVPVRARPPGGGRPPPRRGPLGPGPGALLPARRRPLPGGL